MLAGIDVATYQTPAQTTAAVKAGARFVLAKATEGQHSVDARHAAHVTAARAAGALVGHYHFAWLGQSPTTEADHFLATARPQPGDLVALDVEIEHTGASQWPDVAHRLTYTLAWLARVKARTGASPLLYSYVSELTSLCQQAARVGRLTELTSYPLWVADPGKPAGKPRDVGWPVWTMHQHSIAGGVDRNVLNGDADTWRALAVSGAKPVHTDTAPAPAPTSHPLPTTGDPMVRSLTVPVVFTGGDTATADITFDGFRGTPEVLVTPGTPNYKAASYARTATSATIAVKCDWPSTSTVYCSVLVVGDPA